MGRRPLDEIPQQQLVAELRRAIDVARNVNEKSITYERATAKLFKLCRENPQATLRAHVLHNLGCARRDWLRQLASTLPPTNLVWDTENVRISMSHHLTSMGCHQHDTLPVASADHPAT
ncbi:MAG TPA: hypothetical protein VN756_09920 [Solirubrobacterales bacterium]|nr:hypothetical protein [Solirubrobacterales bacterium]